MKSIWRWKMLGVSLSNPTMNPPCTSRPARWIRFTSATRSRLLVLALVALGQARPRQGSRSRRTPVEPGCDHHPHELLVVGQVDRRLGEERTLPPPPSLPLDQRRQQLVFRARLLPMRLSSTKNTGPRQPRLVEAVQLRDDLRRGLGAGPVAELRRHVAELAVERAAAGELHAHRAVAAEAARSQRGTGLWRMSANSGVS